jgi:hypothetical protein
MQSLRHLAGIFFLSVAIPVATAQNQSANDGARPRGTTSTCQNASAPRVDRADHLSQDQAADSARIASDCSGGRAAAATTRSENVQNAPASPSDDAPRPIALTLICHFTSGPRAGEIVDLAGVLGAIPLPVGSVCSDGASSAGIAVIPDTHPAKGSWSSPSRTTGVGTGRGSTICQFMSGPKAHGWHDYAPLPPAPIGSRCQDEMNSVGIVMASGHGEQY